MRRHVIMLIVTVVAIVGTFVATLLSDSRPVLGLDLQGGISIVLFPVKGSDLERAQHRGRRHPQPRRRPRHRRARRAAPGQHDRREPARREGPRQGREPRRRDRRAAVPAGPVLGQHAVDLPVRRRPRRPPRGQGRDHHGEAGRRPPRSRRERRAPRSAVDHVGQGRRTSRQAAGRRSPPRRSSPRRRRRPRPTATTAAAAPDHRGGRHTDDGATGVDDHDHDRRHDHHGPAQAFPGCAALIKQSPPDTDGAQQVVLPDRKQHSRATCSARRSSPGRASARRTSRTTPRRRSGSPTSTSRTTTSSTRSPARYVNKQVAIELDGVVQSAPKINPGITGRDVEITGDVHAGRGEAARARAAVRRAAGAVRPAEADGRERVADARQGPAHRRASSPGLIGLGARRALHARSSTGCSASSWSSGSALTGMLFFTVVSYLSTVARAHAHAGRRDRHHRVGRCHRRLLRRVLRATQRRGAHRQDDPVVARARLHAGRSARSSPPTSCRCSAPSCSTCSRRARCAASPSSSVSPP